MADEVDELIERAERGLRPDGYSMGPGAMRLIEDLVTALRALRKDRERLDKLWRNTGGTADDGGGWTAFWSFPFIPRDRDLCGWPDDIRDAIDAMDDAAMAAESARGDAA